MIHTYIKQLVEYGIEKGLLEPCDSVYTTNLLLDMLEADTYDDPGEVKKNRNAFGFGGNLKRHTGLCPGEKNH